MTQLKSLRSLVLSTTFAALLPLSVFAADFAVFSSKTGFADGWKSASWSGPTTQEIEGATKGTTALQIALSGDSKAYAGVILTANAGSGVDLTDKLRQAGSVQIHLKLGKTAAGVPSTSSQTLQLALSFLTKEGETVHGAFNTVVTVNVASATSPAGQLVTIPVAKSFEGVKAADQLASISGVRFQFVDTPVAGFSIVDCTIKSE